MPCFVALGAVWGSVHAGLRGCVVFCTPKSGKKYTKVHKTNESDSKGLTCLLRVLTAVGALKWLSVALVSPEGHLWVSARPQDGQMCFASGLTSCLLCGISGFSGGLTGLLSLWDL